MPWGKLSKAQQRVIIEGDGSWDSESFPASSVGSSGSKTKTYKMHVRVLLARYRSYDECRTCGGKRLNEQALSHQVDGLSLCGLSLARDPSGAKARRRAPDPDRTG